jgi:hypothetical protein
MQGNCQLLMVTCFVRSIRKNELLLYKEKSAQEVKKGEQEELAPTPLDVQQVLAG